MQSVGTRGRKRDSLDFVTSSWQHGIILPSLKKKKRKLVFDVTIVFIYQLHPALCIIQGDRTAQPLAQCKRCRKVWIIMNIFNQVTDMVGTVRVFREAQAPDKYVTIYDNFAKSFCILQLQLLLSDSCEMWNGRTNVSKITLSVSNEHIICLKGEYMPAHPHWWVRKRLFVYFVLIGRFHPTKRPLLSDFCKWFRTRPPWIARHLYPPEITHASSQLHCGNLLPLCWVCIASGTLSSQNNGTASHFFGLLWQGQREAPKLSPVAPGGDHHVPRKQRGWVMGRKDQFLHGQEPGEMITCTGGTAGWNGGEVFVAVSLPVEQQGQNYKAGSQPPWALKYSE